MAIEASNDLILGRSTIFSSCYFFFNLICVLDIQRPTSKTPSVDKGDMNEMGTTVMQLTDETTNEYWFDEPYYRMLINYTVGTECISALAKNKISLGQWQGACLCYYVCYHRQQTFEEMMKSAAILKQMKAVIIERRLNEKWPLAVAYGTISLIGVPGNVRLI